MNTASRMNDFFNSIGKKHLPLLLACSGGAAAVYAASMFSKRKIYNEEMADRPAAMTNPAW